MVRTVTLLPPRGRSGPLVRTGNASAAPRLGGLRGRGPRWPPSRSAARFAGLGSPRRPVPLGSMPDASHAPTAAAGRHRRNGDGGRALRAAGVRLTTAGSARPLAPPPAYARRPLPGLQRFQAAPRAQKPKKSRICSFPLPWKQERPVYHPREPDAAGRRKRTRRSVRSFPPQSPDCRRSRGCPLTPSSSPLTGAAPRRRLGPSGARSGRWRVSVCSVGPS